MTGIVKSYSIKHGYGFITSEGRDYRFKSFEMRLPPLKGEKVSFVPYETEKGLRATKVRSINV